MPENKFYINALPGAPFDYHWEVRPHFDQLATRHYIGRPAHLEPVPEEMTYETRRAKDEWELWMVCDEDESRNEHTIISSLTDDSLRNAARQMVEKFILRNRIKVLEEETVRLVADDDPQ
jgi:hypothetical protein